MLRVCFSPSQSAVAGNKKKVTEIRDWLSEVFGLNLPPGQPPPKIAKYRVRRAGLRPLARQLIFVSRRLLPPQRILALTGPSGVGKTTALRTVARELGVEIVEWVEGAEEYAIGSSVGVHRLSPSPPRIFSSVTGMTLMRQTPSRSSRGSPPSSRGTPIAP